METAYHLLPQSEPREAIPAGTVLYAHYEDAAAAANAEWLPPNVWRVDTEGYELERSENFVYPRNVVTLTALSQIPSTRLSLTHRAATVHGTEAQYRKGCRCVQCREAANVAGTARRKRILERGEFAHGLTGYSYGCRCVTCSRASAADAERRPFTVENMLNWLGEDDVYRRFSEEEGGDEMDWVYLVKPYAPVPLPEPGGDLVYATREPEVRWNGGGWASRLGGPESAVSAEVFTTVALNGIPEELLDGNGILKTSEALRAEAKVKKLAKQAVWRSREEKLAAVRRAIVNELSAYGDANDGFVPPMKSPLYRRLYARAHYHGLRWEELKAEAGVKARRRGPAKKFVREMPQDFSGALLPTF